MKALVIGGTGIIGNHVIRSLLLEGIEVRSLSRGVTPSRNLEGLSVEKVHADLNDVVSLAKAFKGCQWVFHTAPYYPQNMFDREKHIHYGMEGVRSILKVAKDHSIDRFVYTSSLTTIGKPSKGEKLADETCAYDLIDDPPHPYFAVKYLMEEEVKKAAMKGLPAIIVNPTGCFGPYEQKPLNLCLIPQLINQKIPAYVNRPINVVNINDVGRGHVLAALYGRKGERYILGGHNVTSRWVIQKICEIGKVRSPKLQLPLVMALLPSALTELIGYFINKPALMPILGLRFVQFGQHFNLSKAKTELRYSISEMEPCFEKAIHWFKKIKYC